MLQRISMLSLLVAALVFAGCDNTDPDGDTVVRGRVTDESGASKVQANIEGATVTAFSVDANGQLNQLGGQASTNAEGRYTLSVDGAPEAFVVVATKGDFRSSTIVFTDDNASVNAMPMTSETDAEASVFAEIRGQSQAQAGAVTLADIAAHVTSQVAADIRANQTTAAQVAAAIRNQSQAEKKTVEEKEDDGPKEFEEQQEEENDAFFELQADLSAATSTSAQADAIAAFQENVVEAGADISAETRAQARQAAQAALVKFSGNISSDARFSMRKQGEILSAIATANAIRASFEAAGASSTRLEALDQARSRLLIDLRAATSASAVEAAKEQFESSVRAELSSSIDINAEVFSALDSILDSVASAGLNIALTTAGSGEAVANAFLDFFTTAQSQLKARLLEEFSGNAQAEANANFGAQVLALLAFD